MFKVRKKCGENFVVGLKIKQVNLWKSFRTTFFGLFSTVFSIVVGKILVRAAYSFPVSQQNKNKGEKRTATSQQRTRPFACTANMGNRAAEH